ncbi:MAG: glycosyltransferase family 39 protein [Bacillati bacterium ANGP1]|uniref:Glycosyltransferase family 39 protein n=1 Tax=Candidatus Segetimicrobium genomatis TaxID=2569760 RepID=A0A537K0A6_9BACT|nr:MAG: glycosyltransferase family 39 protein [Terrabacteria group bacterium ANGP1]
MAGDAGGRSTPPRVSASGRWLVLGIGLLALARVVVAARIPVIDDEAYYWLWSRHLALSYLDHPPLVAWLDALTTAAGRTGWLLRLPAMLATLATTALLYLLGRDLFDAQAGRRAAALHLAVPIFALQAVDAIPDPLLYAWWALGLWAFWRAVHGSPRLWWLCGAALGFGVLSKYPMIVLLAAALGVLSRPPYRRWWRTPGPYTAGILAAVLAAPVLVWNARHGWASLVFWLHAGGAQGPPGGNPRGWGVLANTAVQLAYGGPLLFPAMLWALWRSWREGRRDERFAFLALAGFPTLLIVALGGLLGVDRPNWAAPAYLAGVLALGALWPPRWARAAFASTLALSLAVLALLPFVPALPPALRWDELYGWREVTAEVVRRADALGDPGHVLLVGQRYNQAAYFGYYAPDRLPASTARWSAFSFWAPPHRFAGWQGIAAVDARDAVGALRRDCARLLEQPPYTVPFAGGGGRTFRLFHCVGYRGTPRAP